MSTPSPTTPATPSDEPAPAKVRLAERILTLRARLQDIEEIFADCPYPPSKNADFKKILSDKFASIAVSYVLEGKASEDEAPTLKEQLKQPTTPDVRERQLKERGFAVASSPATTPPVEGGVEGETGNTPFDSHPAIAMAMEMGFDPNAPLEDE